MNKEKLKKIFKDIYPYVLVVIIVILVRSFLVTPAKVDGSSMEPTLSNNNLCLPADFDVAVLKLSKNPVVSPKVNFGVYPFSLWNMFIQVLKFSREKIGD